MMIKETSHIENNRAIGHEIKFIVQKKKLKVRVFPTRIGLNKALLLLIIHFPLMC